MIFEWRDFALGLPLGVGLAVLNTFFWWWLYPELPESPIIAFIALMNFMIMNVGLGLAACYREWRKKK